MSASSTQVARLMSITPYLRARPEGVPLSELAEEFGVTPAVMRRDLQTLVMCGLPELLPDDLIDIDLEAFEEDPEGVVRINNADFMPRPTRLRSGEAASLLVALHRMAEDSDEETRQRIAAVCAKLELATMEGASGKVSVVATPAAATQAELKRTIEEAISSDRQLQVTYLNTVRDELSERTIDPIAVLRDGSRSYLDAWCHRSGGRRLFRIDRMQQVALLDTPREQTTLPAREPGELFEPSVDHVVATLRLGPEARWMTSYYPVLSSEEAGDGSLVVTLHVSDPRWLVGTVLSAAPHVEVVSPPEYASLVAQAVSDTLAAYDGYH